MVQGKPVVRILLLTATAGIYTSAETSAYLVDFMNMAIVLVY